jgi:hypothetical protein
VRQNRESTIREIHFHPLKSVIREIRENPSIRDSAHPFNSWHPATKR